MITFRSMMDPVGSITFFTGPMACGKTLELVRHLQIFHEQKIPLVCLRPAVDTRSSQVQSRSGLLYHSLTVDPNNVQEIGRLLDQHQVIGVDEIQFFPVELVAYLERAMRQGKIILASGLDTDFRGTIFPTAQALMAIPETLVHRSRAVCSICLKHNATRTQRLRGGEPVPATDPLVLIDQSAQNVTYEARCLEHHTIK
jgi:thymidine kinase